MSNKRDFLKRKCVTDLKMSNIPLLIYCYPLPLSLPPSLPFLLPVVVPSLPPFPPLPPCRDMAQVMVDGEVITKRYSGMMDVNGFGFWNGL